MNSPIRKKLIMALNRCGIVVLDTTATKEAHENELPIMSEDEISICTGLKLLGEYIGHDYDVFGECWLLTDNAYNLLKKKPSGFASIGGIVT